MELQTVSSENVFHVGKKRQLRVHCFIEKVMTQMISNFHNCIHTKSKAMTYRPKIIGKWKKLQFLNKIVTRSEHKKYPACHFFNIYGVLHHKIIPHRQSVRNSTVTSQGIWGRGEIELLCVPSCASTPWKGTFKKNVKTANLETV